MQQCITVNQEGRKTVANGDIGASTKGLPHTRMDGFTARGLRLFVTFVYPTRAWMVCSPMDCIFPAVRFTPHAHGWFWFWFLIV